jgi:hypothetical protein
MRNSGFVVRVMGLGAAAAFALQSAQAGERKPAAAQAHHLGASAHRVALVAPARSSLRADLPKTSRDVTSWRDNFGATSLRKDRVKSGRESAGVPGGANRNAVARSEFSFVAVTPLGTEAGGHRSEPAAPQERKSITFFRLDSKLGDVSVQPVVGGVNGAQVLVGF